MISRHHLTRNTVEAQFHCNKCGKATMHSMSNGHKVGCIPCKARQDMAREERNQQAPEPVQGGLF
jgi:formylmethanofuran dehydrogenase subunit E